MDDYKCDRDWWRLWWCGTPSPGISVGNGEERDKQKQKMKVGGAHVTAPMTTGNPSSHFAHSRAIITNRFITSRRTGKPSSVFVSAVRVLPKCLHVKFKQHKCLSAKQSSSESCGTQSSLFGGNYIAQRHGAEAVFLFLWFSLYTKKESPGSCILLFKKYAS